MADWLFSVLHLFILYFCELSGTFQLLDFRYSRIQCPLKCVNSKSKKTIFTILNNNFCHFMKFNVINLIYVLLGTCFVESSYCVDCFSAILFLTLDVLLEND